jgi:ureidoglycolate lyase
MKDRTIVIQEATPQAVAPFGQFIGAHADLPVFARWPGVAVYGATPIVIGSDTELLFAEVAAARFPARIALLERHPNHTQTYLSANGRPFLMVLGRETLDGLPDPAGLQAFVFRDGAGVAMAPGIWHEFPLALEDDTRFTVLLSAASHIDLSTAKAHPADARGPDLERYDMAARAALFVTF